MAETGKMLLGVGLLLVAIGGILLIAARFGLHFGRLPGDVAYRGKNISILLPFGSSFLISLFLSIIFYVVSRFRR